MVKYNENAIREAAYYNWQNAGCPMGKDEYFWAMAIEQLNNSCSCNSSKKVSCKKSTSSLKKNNTMNISTIKASTKVATKKVSKK